MRIDSHQHFWVYNDRDYGWMTAEEGSLRRDYLPGHLGPLLAEVGFEGSIAVQARQLPEETEWLLELSENNAFVRGVVGWVDLRSAAVEEELARRAENPRLCGVRHVIHDEPDDGFMLRNDFRRGISRLRQFNLTYDLLLRPHLLRNAIRLVAQFPDQPFVVDHIAKPDIRGRGMHPWKEELAELAGFQNVWCKASGMVTEADWPTWETGDLRPYLDVVFDAFGCDRVMIGSDWPVCTLAGSYRNVMHVVMDYVSQFDDLEQAKVLGDNCLRFYGLAAGPRSTLQAGEEQPL